MSEDTAFDELADHSRGIFAAGLVASDLVLVAEFAFLLPDRYDTMNRAELIEALAERAELTKAQTARMLDAVLDVITATIAAGEQVALIGFGTFKRALRAAREGRNPATGATLKIAAAKLPKFAAGATLKAAVAGEKSAPKKTTPKPAAKKAEMKPATKNPAAKRAEAKPIAKKPAAKKK